MEVTIFGVKGKKLKIMHTRRDVKIVLFLKIHYLCLRLIFLNYRNVTVMA